MQITNSFKQILGQEKSILIHFLNSVFEREGRKIKEIIHVNTNIDDEGAFAKESLMEVRLKTDSGKTIEVLIQIGPDNTEREAMLFNYARFSKRRIEQNGFYDSTHYVSVFILNVNVIHETERFRTVYKLAERESNYVLEDAFEMHIIELCKLPDFKVADIGALNDLQKWGMFLNYATKHEAREFVQHLRQEVKEIDMAAEQVGDGS